MRTITWDVASLVPQALADLGDVLVVSCLGQSEDHLHDVPVHQTAVCTFSHLQSLTGSQRGHEAVSHQLGANELFPNTH